MPATAVVAGFAQRWRRALAFAVGTIFLLAKLVKILVDVMGGIPINKRVLSWS